MNLDVLKKKAEDARKIYDYLAKEFKIETKIPVNFLISEKSIKELKKSNLTENPFPHVIAFVLAKLRKAGVTKLFTEEKVLQTPVIAAVLSLCAMVATEIGELRGDTFDGDEIDTDILYAGMQAIRLYMVNYKDKAYKKTRLKSAIRVDNAINGSFYKYKTKDDRYISFHTYYQSQQEKLVKELNLKKPSEKFTLMSTKGDIKYLASVVKELNSFELEERAFNCGACACVLRDREEFQNSEVGKAVLNMPLVRYNDFKPKKLDFGNSLKYGPLTGVRVLDLTHIIAGPAASRILAEYGADVLMVRRGKYVDQEQAMLELDGYAGKQSIQLDLNKPDDLAKIKKLIKETHIVTYSYQNNAFDKFGLSKAEIRAINPSIIFANLMCFSDSVWVNRPGWAPLAEDITGLSIRNGSKEKPVNLNGVPLDYIPGFILALGTLVAIRDNLKNGRITDVTTSLTKGAMLLHEMTDLCNDSHVNPSNKTSVIVRNLDAFKNKRVYINTKAIGSVGFPYPATYHTKYNDLAKNMDFSDGNKNFRPD